jgi:hypothetical protein
MKAGLSQDMAVRATVLIIGVITPLAYIDTTAQAGQSDIVHPAPLFENLGTLEHRITTNDPGAQAYFNQGLRLIYAFNHAEAIRSFEEAARIDPTRPWLIRASPMRWVRTLTPR